MDGSDSLRFRRVLPTANILAFEPNPANFTRMEANARLRAGGIRIFPFAASDSLSQAPFFVVSVDKTGKGNRSYCGISSLHRRPGFQVAEAEVTTIRLDALLADESLDKEPIALWIDTEGMAFETIRGAAGVLRSIRLIHVEVETAAIIGANQKLFTDVDMALTDAGFTLLATDQPIDRRQFNALYVRADVLRDRATRIRFWTVVLRLRRLVTENALRHVPKGWV
jgi:FkbM family methyltransferase